MREVTRYDLNEDVATGELFISPVPKSMEGGYVSYEDYAALQQRLDAVLAENVALTHRAEASEAELVSDDEFRASFERWMINDMKCVIGSSDPYPAGIEARNWNAWKACLAAILRNIEEQSK